MMLLGNINAIPFRRGRFGGGGGTPFPNIPGMIARYSALGLTNEQMAANPVWVDKTGNGHDIQLKNFSWKGMSGVGGYKFNFLSNEWIIDNNQVSKKYSYKIVINNKRNSVQLHNRINLGHIKITLKITGIEINKSTFRVYDNVGREHAQDYTKDGIYEIDYTANEGANIIYFYVFGGNMGQLENPITIEQLPLYPDSIVFNGVDDYGICENFPILTKEKGYTVVALRQWIEEKNSITALVSNSKNWNQDGAFVFEYNNLENNCPNIEISFGSSNIFDRGLSPYSYQTSKSYNGNLIKSRSFLGSDKLVVAKANENFSQNSNVAIWELVFLDHDATEEELTKIKDYFVKTYPWLFPDQGWTVAGKTNEDTDRATIANITGNGNNLVLSNFGFAENSGYGLYAYNFNSFTLRDNVVKPTDVKNDSFRIVGTGNSSNVPVLSKAFNSANWKIRVTGMKEGDNLIVGNANKSGDYFTITKDGIYTFQKQYEASSTNGVWYNSAQETDVLVEQIPEYEGYLVTDGVDDKIISSNFKFGENYTVVGEWKFLQEASNVYAGFMKNPNYWALYNYKDGINAYIKADAQGSLISGVRSIKASTSKGDIYPDFNSYVKIEPGKRIESQYALNIAVNSSIFTKLAFKNLAIYPTVLSKEDCIKAYNYLQTLKAK